MQTHTEHIDVAAQTLIPRVAPLSPAPRKVVGFVVGLENYQPCKGQMPVVHYAHNDARAFANTLRNLYRGIETDVVVLLDADATKTRLQYELRETIRGLAEGDLFVFYYAGHGYHDVHGNRISAWDSSAWNTETTLLIREALLDPLRQSACRQALLFIDACAVEVQALVQSRDVLASLDPGELRSFLGNARYCATFLSCSPGQKSYPSDELAHGIWTHFLLKALRGDAPEAIGPGRFLTDVGLRDYLKAEVPGYIKDRSLSSLQTPMAMLEATNTVGLLELFSPHSEDANALPLPDIATATIKKASRGTLSKPARIAPRASSLVLVSNCSTDGNSPNVVTLTLTTDEPEALCRRIDEFKQQIENQVLDKSLVVPNAPLATLLNQVTARWRILDWLAATSFSAHLYFSSRSSLADEVAWPQLRRTTEFIVLPLVHRLSDKSMSVRKLASHSPGIEPYLDAALTMIEAKFHRVVPRPSTVGRERNPTRALLELAELVLECCQSYLANPHDETARNIFAHVRTRLKYAANVHTRERHTRDKNPLP